MDKSAPKVEVLFEGDSEDKRSSVVEVIEKPTQPEEAAAPPSEHKKSEPEVKAKTGRAKRREKRLRHEPQNVTRESLGGLFAFCEKKRCLAIIVSAP